jgi:Fe-S-cluster containining protein
MHLRNVLGSGTLRAAEAAIGSASSGAEFAREAACFRSVAGLPHGARVVLSHHSCGRCIFLDADRHCGIHRHLGPDALPSACRDFPRVVTLTPLGVSITLSHYCPTAASMLLAPVTLSDSSPPGVGSEALSSTLSAGERRGSAARILEDPPNFPPSWPYEGLDAREALPPLLRPGVLMDWPSLERWEEFAVSVLGDDRRTPETALEILAGAAEEARGWTPADGEFGEYFARILSFRGTLSGVDPKGSSGAGGSPSRADPCATLRASPLPELDRRSPDDEAAWSLVSSCVPHRALLPSPPGGLDDADLQLVAPGWPSLAGPIRRWLAAKAFASWLALQGEGLRTTVLGLHLALGVLRAEAARACAEGGRPLDAELLKEAVRRADLLLVHLVDPAVLAKRLSPCELPDRPRRAW